MTLNNSKKVSEYQRRYYYKLTQTKEHIFYLSEYIQSCEKWSWRINFYLALTSSSAIGAWAIWQELRLVWTIFIALSQVLNTIKPLLQFERKLKILYLLQREMELIFIEMEMEWFDISRGKLTEREIHEKNIEFTRKLTVLENDKLNNITLPENESFVRKAKIQRSIYFKNNYF